MDSGWIRVEGTGPSQSTLWTTGHWPEVWPLSTVAPASQVVAPGDLLVRARSDRILTGPGRRAISGRLRGRPRCWTFRRE